MAYALVGTIGTAILNFTTGGAVSPAWGTGESRTAGNLLVCWVSGTGAATLPAAPAGWSTALQVPFSTRCSISIFYLIAAGGDAAPTIAGVSGASLAAQLAEFSGNATTSPLDQTGSQTGTTSPLVATAAGVDAASGELIVYGSAMRYSAGAAKTVSTALNNATAADTTDNATSTANHYDFGYGSLPATAPPTKRR